MEEQKSESGEMPEEKTEGQQSPPVKRRRKSGPRKKKEVLSDDLMAQAFERAKEAINTTNKRLLIRFRQERDIYRQALFVALRDLGVEEEVNETEF